MNKFRAPHLRQPEPQPCPPRARAALAVRGRGALCSGSCSPAPALARRGRGAWCALQVRSVCCFVSFGPVPLYLLHFVLPAWFFFFLKSQLPFFHRNTLKRGWFGEGDDLYKRSQIDLVIRSKKKKHFLAPRGVIIHTWKWQQEEGTLTISRTFFFLKYILTPPEFNWRILMLLSFFFL